MNIYTEKILKIDRIEGIMGYSFSETGTPFWPLLRWSVYVSLRGLAKKKTPKKTIDVKEPLKKGIKESLKRVYRIMQNRKIVKKKEILFFKTNRGRVLEGKYHENVYDAFIKANMESSVVLKPYNFVKEHKDQIDYDVCYREGFLTLREERNISSISDLPRADKQRFEDFLRVLENEGNIDKEIIECLNDEIVNIYKRITFNKIIINRICKMMKNLKVVVVSEGCYSYNTEICQFFHEHDFYVLEIQHGNISEHPSYNYSGELNTEYMALFQPDCFGVWSDFWGEKCNMQPEVVVFGNSEIDLGLEIFQKNTVIEGREVLFCASASLEKNIQLLDQFLLLSRSDICIVVRLHPLYNQSRQALEERYKGIENVKIDNSLDIYSAMRGKEALLAENSTVLFEAESCGVRAYNIINDWGSEAIQAGIIVHDMNELVELMDKVKGQKINANDYRIKYFGINGVEKYKDFVSKTRMQHFK